MNIHFVEHPVSLEFLELTLRATSKRLQVSRGKNTTFVVKTQLVETLIFG